MASEHLSAPVTDVNGSNNEHGSTPVSDLTAMLLGHEGTRNYATEIAEYLEEKCGIDCPDKLKPLLNDPEYNTRAALRDHLLYMIFSETDVKNQPTMAMKLYADALAYMGFETFHCPKTDPMSGEGSDGQSPPPKKQRVCIAARAKLDDVCRKGQNGESVGRRDRSVDELSKLWGNFTAEMHSLLNQLTNEGMVWVANPPDNEAMVAQVSYSNLDKEVVKEWEDFIRMAADKLPQSQLKATYTLADGKVKRAVNHRRSKYLKWYAKEHGDDARNEIKGKKGHVRTEAGPADEDDQDGF